MLISKKNLIASLSIINFLKTKIKSYGDEVKDLVNSKGELNRTCSAVISLDSALKKDENYYPQVFLKESVNILRKKIFRHIIDDLISSSDDSDDSDEE